ncbi:hypothetical protein HBH61_226780 [Parastagonospora nodorum]|nr:hypothetical protein HBH61_226780 [Parastagonospora nodorum]
MAQLTTADLSELPSSYELPRDIGDVLIGEDTARPLTEACSSSNDTTLRGLLLSLMNKAISSRHAAVIKALASADLKVITFLLFHGALLLYEAIRLRKPDVVAVLLELRADPLHPISFLKTLDTYSLYLISYAVFSIPSELRIIKMLIKHGTSVAGTGALHCAARSGKLSIMRLLIQHGADANETISNLYNWTPMHFAASRGQIDAMKLLEEYGARSDFKDEDRKTAAQLLDERKAVEH